MPCEPDHRLLSRFAVAQARGDRGEAAEIWERLALNNFDRVTQIVKAFEFSPGRRLPEHEHGSAASEAYLRVVAMGAGFRGREAGVFYAALYTCVNNACLDYGRKELRHQRRSAGSVDQRFDPDSDSGPFDRALAAHDADLRRRSEEAIEAELDRLEAESLGAWAIGQIRNDNYREVLEMTFQQLPAEAIAERLAISMDNLYQRRSRGLKELERILRDTRS